MSASIFYFSHYYNFLPDLRFSDFLSSGSFLIFFGKSLEKLFFGRDDFGSSLIFFFSRFLSRSLSRSERSFSRSLSRFFFFFSFSSILFCFSSSDLPDFEDFSLFSDFRIFY